MKTHSLGMKHRGVWRRSNVCVISRVNHALQKSFRKTLKQKYPPRKENNNNVELVEFNKSFMKIG